MQDTEVILEEREEGAHNMQGEENDNYNEVQVEV